MRLGAGLLLFLLAGCGESRNPGVFQRLHDDLATGNLAAAKTSLEQFIRSHPGSPLTARAYNDLGVINHRLGDEAQALEALEDSLRLDGEYAPAAYNLGVMMIQRGDLVQGMTRLHDAVRFDETDTRALEYAADVVGSEGDWEQAADLLQEARVRDPSSAVVLTALALAQLRTTGPDEALTSLRSALEADPRFAPALFNQGVIHGLWKGDPTNGVSSLEEYLEFGTDDTQAMRAMDLLSEFRAHLVATDVEEPVPAGAQPDPYTVDGIQLLRENRNEEALRAFQRGVANRSDSVPAYLGIAEAAMRLNQPVSARVALDRALRLEPENREAMWGIAAFLDRTSADPAEAVLRYQNFVRRFPDDERSRTARERIASLLSASRE
jgi:tetratricopeptide (TPR) repeat protein